VSLETRGTYTGNLDANYLIEITQATTGNFATARWRWSDVGGAPWNAENLTPVDGVWVTLNNGLDVRWVDTTATLGSPQFVVGDYYLARALRPYGIVAALDGSRNSEYRSGDLPASSTLRIGFDMGTAVSPGLLVVDDHNLPSNATVTLRADASTLFDASPDLNQAVTWRANRLVEFITGGPYRHWWLNIVMGATPLEDPDFLRISELFLGAGVTFNNACRIGMTLNRQWLGTLDVAGRSTRGSHPRLYAADMPERTWSLVKRDATEDGGRLDAAFAYAQTHASYTLPSFYFLSLDDVVTNVEMLSWAGDLQRSHVFGERWDYSVQWAEVLRTVSS
jgi:hypothetical protein